MNPGMTVVSFFKNIKKESELAHVQLTGQNPKFDLSMIDLPVEPSDPNGGEIIAFFVKSISLNETNTVNEFWSVSRVLFKNIKK